MLALIISIMLYIPKIADYLKILTDEEVKNYWVHKFSEYFTSLRKFYSKLSKEKNLRIIAELFYSFLTTLDKVGKFVEIINKWLEAKTMT